MTDTHVPRTETLTATSSADAVAIVDAAIERGRRAGRASTVVHIGLDNRELILALDGADAADALVASSLDRLDGLSGLVSSTWMGGDDLIVVIDAPERGVETIRSDIADRLDDVVELGHGTRTAIRFGIGVVRDGDGPLPSTRLVDRHLLDDARADLTADRRQRNRIVLDIGDVLIDTTPESQAQRRVDLRIPSLSDALIDERQRERDDRSPSGSVRR